MGPTSRQDVSSVFYIHRASSRLVRMIPFFPLFLTHRCITSASPIQPRAGCKKMQRDDFPFRAIVVARRRSAHDRFHSQVNQIKDITLIGNFRRTTLSLRRNGPRRKKPYIFYMQKMQKIATSRT